MDAKRVGDIMMPLEVFPYCPFWFTLRQALAEVEEQEIKRAGRRSVPWLILVFSAQNQLLGIVRRREILQGMRSQLDFSKVRGYVPNVADVAGDPELLKLGFSPAKVLNHLRTQMERQIIELMSPIETTVGYDDPALIAMFMMIDRNLSFLPVARDKRIVGLVYAEDILHEVIAQIV